MEAYDLLGWLRGSLQSQGRVLDVIEALLLSAICKRRMEAENASWRPLLKEAMELAQPYGYTALFAEMGAALLPLLHEISWPEHEEYLLQLRQETQRQARRFPGYLSPFNAGTAYLPALPPDLLNEQEKIIFQSIYMRQTNEQICGLLGLSNRQLGQLMNGLYTKLCTRSRKRIREMGEVFFSQNEFS